MRYLLALALVVLTSSVAHADHHKKKAVSLFNGKDLSGWVVMYDGDWKVEEGVIVGRKGVKWTTDPKKSGSWLRTEKEFSNFVFEFEYAINKKGNSGVFLRSGLKENPAFTGHEMQILDDHGRAKPEVWSTGALYDVVAAKKNMSKPAGEWNKVKIETDGPRIRIWFNGEQIVDHKSDRRTKGYLGLQNHDERAVVKYRDLVVTEK
ncbi:MAG: DUF1080 domain-containing protein [Roseibacillus sp.]